MYIYIYIIYIYIYIIIYIYIYIYNVALTITTHVCDQHMNTSKSQRLSTELLCRVKTLGQLFHYALFQFTQRMSEYLATQTGGYLCTNNLHA